MRPLLTGGFSSIVTSYLNHLNSLNKYLRFILEFFWNTSISIELVISGKDEKAERAGQATSKTGMQEMCVGGVASLHAHRLHHINDTCSAISLSAYHQSLLCSSHLQNLLSAGDLKKFIHM